MKEWEQLLKERKDVEEGLKRDDTPLKSNTEAIKEAITAYRENVMATKENSHRLEVAGKERDTPRIVGRS